MRVAPALSLNSDCMGLSEVWSVAANLLLSIVDCDTDKQAIAFLQWPF